MQGLWLLQWAGRVLMTQLVRVLYPSQRVQARKVRLNTKYDYAHAEIAGGIFPLAHPPRTHGFVQEAAQVTRRLAGDEVCL